MINSARTRSKTTTLKLQSRLYVRAYAMKATLNGKGKKHKFQEPLTTAGLKWPHRCWVKMLKTRVHPNTISTQNVWEIGTLTRLQQKGQIPWAQIILNHLTMMTQTKVVILMMSDIIVRILEYIGVPI